MLVISPVNGRFASFAVTEQHRLRTLCAVGERFPSTSSGVPFGVSYRETLASRRRLFAQSFGVTLPARTRL